MVRAELRACCVRPVCGTNQASQGTNFRPEQESICEFLKLSKMIYFISLRSFEVWLTLSDLKNKTIHPGLVLISFWAIRPWSLYPKALVNSRDSVNDSDSYFGESHCPLW